MPNLRELRLLAAKLRPMTNFDSLLAMAMFAFATSATPGPVNLISAMSGARYGLVRSLPYVVGATTSFCAILIAIGMGVSVVHHLVIQASLPLTILGSAYLIWLAIKIARADGHIDLEAAEAGRPSFVSGLFIQAINPKAWIVSLSAITIYVLPKADFAFQLAAFTGLFYLICALSLAGWVFVGAQVARITDNFRRFNQIMAALLVLSVLYILGSEIAMRW